MGLILQRMVVCVVLLLAACASAPVAEAPSRLPLVFDAQDKM